MIDVHNNDTKCFLIDINWYLTIELIFQKFISSVFLLVKLVDVIDDILVGEVIRYLVLGGQMNRSVETQHQQSSHSAP